MVSRAAAEAAAAGAGAAAAPRPRTTPSTIRSKFICTVHCDDVPELMQAPPQPVNDAPVLGDSVSVTELPCG